MLRVFVLFLCLCGGVCYAEPKVVNKTVINKAIDVLNEFYYNETGFYNGVEDWHNANILEILSNKVIWMGWDDDVVAIIDGMYYAQNVSITCAGLYNDDILWYVLGWHRAYIAIGDLRFLERAQSLFSCVVDCWDDVCGGGLYWNEWRDYKNAVTNSLFVIAAAKLGESEWYNRGLQWWLESDMLGDNWLVYDGLNSTCANNRWTTWTYNQGLSLAFLNNKSGTSIIQATQQMLVSDGGVLEELCEKNSELCNPPCPYCDNDQSQFKGIFMRYLGYFMEEFGAVDKLVDWIDYNAQKLLDVYGSSAMFGLSWSGRVNETECTYVTQSSALDMLLIAHVFG